MARKKRGNPRSAHKRGVACDFRLDGVGIETIRDYLRATYHNVGVGYYPNAGFIHVDVGRSHSGLLDRLFADPASVRAMAGRGGPTGGDCAATTIPASEATVPPSRKQRLPQQSPRLAKSRAASPVR